MKGSKRLIDYWNALDDDDDEDSTVGELDTHPPPPTWCFGGTSWDQRILDLLFLGENKIESWTLSQYDLHKYHVYMFMLNKQMTDIDYLIITKRTI